MPVGAVLTINDKLIGRESNLATTRDDWFSHAESSLLSKVSGAIKKNKGSYIKLYSTWEPCLMCASAAFGCRVNKIIFACYDPKGGVSKINPKDFPDWYKEHWPNFEKGEYEKESYELLTRYMREHKDIWGKFLNEFQLK